MVVGLGLIGSAVVKKLEAQKHRVIKVVQKELNRPKYMTGADYYLTDVSNFNEIKQVALRLKQARIVVNGIIYAVGKDKKTIPCKQRHTCGRHFSPKMFAEETALQYLGTRYVYEAMVRNMSVGGSMVFVSSPTHEYDSYDFSCLQKELLLEELRQKPQTKIHRVAIHHVMFEHKKVVCSSEQMADEIIAAILH